MSALTNGGAPMRKLDLEKVAARVEKGENEWDPIVQVTFMLPTGTTLIHNFSPQHDVAQLKAFLETHHQLPYHNVELRLHGHAMPDPLSLCDFSGILESLSADIDVVVSLTPYMNVSGAV